MAHPAAWLVRAMTWRAALAPPWAITGSVTPRKRGARAACFCQEEEFEGKKQEVKGERPVTTGVILYASGQAESLPCDSACPCAVQPHGMGVPQQMYMFQR